MSAPPPFSTTRVTARAKITFSLEVDCGAWDSKCTAGQIREQAIEAAKSAANRVMAAAAEYANVSLKPTGIEEITILFPGER